MDVTDLHDAHLVVGALCDLISDNVRNSAETWTPESVTLVVDIGHGADLWARALGNDHD